MNKEFVPYTEALALKELGFDEPCFGYYVDGELRGINLGMEELGGVEPYYQRFGFHTLSNHDIDNPNKIVATAPTFSQAFRWFRDKHELDSEIYMNHEYGVKIYTYLVLKLEKSIISHKSGYAVKQNTYEEAELACLRHLIEIVKK